MSASLGGLYKQKNRGGQGKQRRCTTCSRFSQRGRLHAWCTPFPAFPFWGAEGKRYAPPPLYATRGRGKRAQGAARQAYVGR